MARSRKLPKSKEEKVVEQLVKIVDTFDLDLEQVGIYLSQIRPHLYYNRLLTIIESAEHETEKINERFSNDTLF
jgi:hypothetical protein